MNLLHQSDNFFLSGDAGSVNSNRRVVSLRYVRRCLGVDQ